MIYLLDEIGGLSSDILQGLVLANSNIGDTREPNLIGRKSHQIGNQVGKEPFRGGTHGFE